MLNPNQRTLYTDCLCPPAGFRFGEALATTYTLDLTTLLSVPLHLALRQSHPDDRLGQDPLALMEALRRVSHSLTVYVDRGQIKAPDRDHVLYSLLEDVAVEVRAPGEGAFHPKLWLVRFVPSGEEDDEPTLLRLLILSRNLAPSRCWDLALLLEGRPGRRRRSESRALGELIGRLPSLAAGTDLSQERKDQAERFAEEVTRVRWELPEGYDSVEFFVNGLGDRNWDPAPSAEMAVLSPFCTADALDHLLEQTGHGSALISRQEQLDALPPAVLDRFERVFQFSEAVEMEDGEELVGSEVMPLLAPLQGLHAKVYVFKEGWDTCLAVGSANATRQALIDGRNVEVVAELRGRASRVGKLSELVGEGGLGDLLEHYQRPVEIQDDPAAAALKRAEERLRLAQRQICGADLRLVAQGVAEDQWELVLSTMAPIQLEGISSMTAWPVTLKPASAVDVSVLAQGQTVTLATLGLSSVCAFVAFRLEPRPDEHLAEPPELRFVLNLPLENPPPGRRAAIVRTVIRNRDGFLRYLLWLLGDLDDFAPGGKLSALFKQFGFGRAATLDEMPLLEELTRTYARKPERLEDVQQLIEQIAEGVEGERVIPPDFWTLWEVFRSAIDAEKGAAQ